MTKKRTTEPNDGDSATYRVEVTISRDYDEIATVRVETKSEASAREVFECCISEIGGRTVAGLTK